MHYQKVRTILIPIIIVLCVTIHRISGESLDPEEMLFIYSRCLEDNPNNRMCSTKCVLEKTRLYDVKSQKFNVQPVKEQLKAYPEVVDAAKANAFADAMGKLPKSENSCKAVHDTYGKAYLPHKDTAKKLFHADRKTIDKVYAKLGKTVRQPNESMFVFCENKFYPEGSANRKDLCKIRQYEIQTSKTYKQLLQCIFKGLRYITKDGKLDRSELKRDFLMVNKDANQLDSVLDKCKAKEPKDGLSLARFYYKCLLDSKVVADFKEAADYREYRSTDYGYNIPKVQKYDKAVVMAEIKEIDKEQCPN